MSSRRTDKTLAAPGTAVDAEADVNSLGEGNTMAINAAEHPIRRDVEVVISSSLNEICLNSGKAVWKPSQEALKSIFQQRRFTGINGASESMGDLSSVVLHDLSVTHEKSTFPISLGVNITGVDDSTFSSVGTPFSTVVHPNTPGNHAERPLQSDDVSLAYEFSKKFPGYTAENLETHGITKIPARRFVLVGADHPVVSAIGENADALQMGEISMMPEGLVKISDSLYNSLIPMVKSQVASQIKVRDFSKTQVSVCPSEYTSWSEAREDLIIQAKKPIKAERQAALSAAQSAGLGEEALAAKKIEINESFAKKEAEIESCIDHKPVDLHLGLRLRYNFLSH